MIILYCQKNLKCEQDKVCREQLVKIIKLILIKTLITMIFKQFKKILSKKGKI